MIFKQPQPKKKGELEEALKFSSTEFNKLPPQEKDRRALESLKGVSNALNKLSEVEGGVKKR